MAILFWLIFMLILYTYIGYPLLLFILARFKAITVNKAEIFPSVSLIIAAYNEEKLIEEKILNCLLLDYPKDKIEIIVASDCSTDKTNEIVKKYEQENVKLEIAEKRAGKTAGRNRAIPRAQGEIIVLSDATGMYGKDVIKKLVRNFNDKTVGCVGGLLRYENSSNSAIGSGEGLYWRYEVLLRKLESLLGNLTAVSGSIYAFKKELYKRIPEELADDLIVPLTVKKSGFFTIFEPEAVCVEKAAKDGREESAKRIRIANRNISGLIYMKELFNFFRYGVFSLELFSHKILRLLMPALLAGLLTVSFILSGRAVFFLSFAVMQTLFYCAATAGYILQMKSKKISKNLYIPLFFCVTNLGVLLGIIKFFNGQKKSIWEPAR